VYQLAGDELTWASREIPRWFSEGLAAVTAGQGYRFADPEALWRFYRELGEGPRPASLRGDPIVDPDPILAEHWKIAYGAAHVAADLLLRRYGDERVREVLRLMRGGRRFPGAFRAAIGISDVEFTADVRRYVLWEGWRR
jgi:hypothetical protein